MAQLKETGFFPGQRYRVQVRAKSKSDPNLVSDWSNILTFTTSADTVPPKAPSNLTLVAEGTSFIAKWKKPTQNANNTSCTDLRGFFVTFKNTENLTEVTREVFTSDESFTLDFDTNKEMFGVARGKITISVVATDLMGNRSNPATASAENPRPANVTGLVVQDALEALSISWDANTTDTDLQGYEVHASTTGPNFTPSASTRKYLGMGTAFLMSASNPVVHYVKVRAVDVFGLYSAVDATGSGTPRTTTGMDNDPPDAPGGVVPSSVDGQLKVTWTAPTAGDISRYVVRYGLSTVDFSYVDVPNDKTDVIIPGVKPGKEYFVSVKAVDYSGNSSTWGNATPYPFEIQRNTTPPNKPAPLSVFAGQAGIYMYGHQLQDVNGNPMPNISLLEIHMATDDGPPQPGLFSRVGEIVVDGYVGAVSKVATLLQEEDVTELYWFTVAVDQDGNRSEPSDPVPGVAGLIENSVIANATIDDAKINTLSAAKLVAGTAFVNDLFIRSKLEIDDIMGIIQSSTWNPTTNTGWKIDRNGITINDGMIKAKAIELQSSPNIAPSQFSGFEFNKEFYCDTTTFAPSAELVASASSLKVDTIATAKFGNQGLRVWDTTAVANNRLTLARAGQYNIEIAGGQTYITSIYVRNNSGASRNFTLRMESQNGETFNAVNTIASGATWVRVSVVGAFTNNASAIRIVLGWDTAAAFDFIVDGLQVERKTGVGIDPSPWQPNGMTSIDGGAITTGSIRSTASAAGIPTQPAWSLNTQGNLQVGDALVRGRLLVGAGSDLANSMVQSTGYSAGNSGWIIKGDGSVEFNNGIFRGTLGAGTVTTESLSSDLVLTDKIIAGVANGARVEMRGGTGVDAGLTAYSAGTTKSLQINTSGVFTAYNGSGVRTLDIDAAGNFRTYNTTTQTAIFTLANNGQISIANSGGNTFLADSAGNLTIRGTIKTANTGARIEIAPAGSTYPGITFYGATTNTNPINFTTWALTSFTDSTYDDGIQKSGFKITSPRIRALKFKDNSNVYYYSEMTMPSNSTEMFSFRVKQDGTNYEMSRMMIRAKDVEIVAGPKRVDPAYTLNNWAPYLYMPWGGNSQAGTNAKPINLISELRITTTGLIHRSGFQASVDSGIGAVVYSDAGLHVTKFVYGNPEWQPPLVDQYAQVTCSNLLAYGTVWGTWGGTSAIQYKESIEELPESALSVVRNAPVSRWKYKDKEDFHVGPMATDLPDWVTIDNLEQEVEHLPTDVGNGREIPQPRVKNKLVPNAGIDMGTQIGLLWAALRELDEELDEWRSGRRTKEALPERRMLHNPPADGVIDEISMARIELE